MNLRKTKLLVIFRQENRHESEIDKIIRFTIAWGIFAWIFLEVQIITVRKIIGQNCTPNKKLICDDAFKNEPIKTALH